MESVAIAVVMFLCSEIPLTLTAATAVDVTATDALDVCNTRLYQRSALYASGFTGRSPRHLDPRSE